MATEATGSKETTAREAPPPPRAHRRGSGRVTIGLLSVPILWLVVFFLVPVVLVALYSVGILTLLKQDLRLTEALGLAIIVGLLAFVSDLGESLLKRSAGVKDSSPLLPGHGGILDRFDSFLLAGPFMYYMAALQWK